MSRLFQIADGVYVRDTSINSAELQPCPPPTEREKFELKRYYLWSLSVDGRLLDTRKFPTKEEAEAFLKQIITKEQTNERED